MDSHHYVAFLRAINVGGRVVKMTDLKKVFEGLRFRDVDTFIASGNVIFVSPSKDSAKLEQQIAAGLQKSLGYPVGTYLRTRREVAAIAERRPFPPKSADGATVYVGFLPGVPSTEAQRKVRGLRTETDEFAVEGRELYWLSRSASMSDSRFNYAVLEKAVGMAATFRNVTTVKRLAAKYPVILL